MENGKLELPFLKKREQTPVSSVPPTPMNISTPRLADPIVTFPSFFSEMTDFSVISAENDGFPGAVSCG